MRMYQVDAFTDRLFAGNPAAVLVLDDWLPDELMLAITHENNLAETAFVKARPDGAWDLRWFAPAHEVSAGTPPLRQRIFCSPRQRRTHSSSSTPGSENCVYRGSRADTGSTFRV